MDELPDDLKQIKQGAINGYNMKDQLWVNECLVQALVAIADRLDKLYLLEAAKAMPVEEQTEASYYQDLQALRQF